MRRFVREKEEEEMDQRNRGGNEGNFVESVPQTSEKRERSHSQGGGREDEASFKRKREMFFKFLH